MIIRKPYAFLIKNFKLIHFIMLIVSTYLAIRTNIISSFFKFPLQKLPSPVKRSISPCVSPVIYSILLPAPF